MFSATPAWLTRWWGGHSPVRLGRGRFRQSTAVGSAGLLIAVLAGAWVGHLVEYLRVWGRGQLPVVLTRAPHTYFGPVGIVLLALAVVGINASMRLARRLERRVEHLRAALVGGPIPDELDGDVPTRTLTFPTLLLVCWTVQLALYLAQENLEGRAFGLPAPGLGAVTGIHVLAPLVHLLVAAAVATAVWLTRRRVTELLFESDWTQARLGRRRERTSKIVGQARIVRAWTPGQCWGMALWARPPPSAVV